MNADGIVNWKRNKFKQQQQQQYIIFFYSKNVFKSKEESLKLKVKIIWTTVKVLDSNKTHAFSMWTKKYLEVVFFFFF